MTFLQSSQRGRIPEASGWNGHQQTGRVQSASVSKTTYFYQMAHKHRLCGPPAFIDAALCAGPGYLTAALQPRLSGRSVWAWPSLAWPRELRPAQSGRFSSRRVFTGNTVLSYFWTDMVFMRKPNTHSQCAETEACCCRGG